MPLSKNIASYPANFYSIARHIQGLREPFYYQCDTSAKATRLRQQFYGFASALEHRAKDTDREPALRDDDLELSNGIRQMEIRKEGSTLIFVSRLDTDAFKLGEMLLLHVQGNAQEIDKRFAASAKTVDERDLGEEAMKKCGYSPREQAPAPTAPPSLPLPSLLEVVTEDIDKHLEAVKTSSGISDLMKGEKTSTAVPPTLPAPLDPTKPRTPREIADAYAAFMARDSNDPEG